MAIRKNTLKVSSSLELFNKSYELVKRNSSSFMVLLALPFIAAVVSTINYARHPSSSNRLTHFNLFSSVAPAYGTVGLIGLSFFVFILVILLSVYLQAMLTCLQLEVSEGKKPDIRQLLLPAKKHWLRLLGLFIMISLYFAAAAGAGLFVLLLFFLVGLSVLGGIVYGLLVLVAGLFIAQHYFLAPYILIDKNVSIFTAMSDSVKLAQRHPIAIWTVLGTVMLIGLTGIIPAIGPLVSFLLGAFYSVAPAIRYRELTN